MPFLKIYASGPTSDILLGKKFICSHNMVIFKFLLSIFSIEDCKMAEFIGNALIYDGQ